MELQILKPVNDALVIQSRIWYNQNDGAWSIIRLKKNVINEFPILKEKRSNFFYKIIHHKTYDDLEKNIRKIKKNKDPVPILLFLYKEKEKIV